MAETLASSEGGAWAQPGKIQPTMIPEERERLRSKFGEQMIAQFELMQTQLESSRAETKQSTSGAIIEQTLVRLTGVARDVWNRAGQEMLEAVMPLQSGTVGDLSESAADRDAATSAARLRIQSVTTVGDFPITTATFGFSRADYQPGACRLNSFPADADHGGKFPIFVDVVQADAILLRLDHGVVLQWMRANGLKPSRDPFAEGAGGGRAAQLAPAVGASQSSVVRVCGLY